MRTLGGYKEEKALLNHIYDRPSLLSYLKCVFTHAHTIISACEKRCACVRKSKDKIPLAAAQSTQKPHQIVKITICTKIEGK
jgi:hypothetical protein